MKKVDVLLRKLAEYEIEDYGCFGGFVVLFANDPKWDALPEGVKAEILELFDQQFEKL
ncbi:hypothetical protein ACKFKG_23485 [Phormidesmis sp. 146-35]